MVIWHNNCALTTMNYDFFIKKSATYDTSRSYLLCLFCFSCLAFSGCSSLFSIGSGAMRPNSNQQTSIIIPEELDPSRKKILEEASILLGTPYCLGGKTPFCTDCSGFMQQVFGKLGIAMPRTAHDQFLQFGSEDFIPEPGDLLFFRYAAEGRIAHVGIYAGNDMMIHASEKKGVIATSLEYMRSYIVGYGRVPIQEFSAK